MEGERERDPISLLSVLSFLVSSLHLPSPTLTVSMPQISWADQDAIAKRLDVVTVQNQRLQAKYSEDMKRLVGECLLSYTLIQQHFLSGHILHS